jgi:two-component system, NarL family, sensor histidine kinase DevS
VTIGAESERVRATADRLWALIEAGVFLSEELDLQAVLARVVETAKDVIGSRYAALGVLDEHGTGLSDFIFRGLSEDHRQKIGHLPVGRGLLGVLITDPQPVRLKELSQDSRSVGFPSHHPPMKSFLGVPVRSKGNVFGNLYLTEKIDADEFTAEDERLAVALAAHAGVAIENARLYEEERTRSEIERELAETRVRSELRDQTLKAVIRAQEEERQRIARELHDSAGQALSSIILGLKVVAQESSIDGARERVGELRQIVVEASREVRRMVRELRPSILDDMGLTAAIDRYVKDLRDSGLTVNATIDIGEERLNPEVETVMYRVAQEALTNVVKYAGARTIDVLLTSRDDSYVLCVADDGLGFEVTEGERSGLGIRGMRERADLVGGRLTLNSTKDGGTRVTLEIPRKEDA